MLIQLDEATVVTLTENECSAIRENMVKHLSPASQQTIKATGEAPYLLNAVAIIEKRCKYLTIVGISKLLDVFRNELRDW